MVYVYLIKSKVTHSFYTGISNDPFRRLIEHNNGILKNTSKKRPYHLVYVKEYDNYINARKHEKWFKKKNKEYKNMLAQLAPPRWAG